jgi:polyribonucleotide nucleotidyltransferase
VCAIQADVKISGIDYNTIKKAMEGGMEANHKILDIMDKCLDRPVESKSCWPVSKNITIPAHKRGKFLGPAGLNVKRISGETGVQIQPEEEGVWSLFAPSSAAMEEAEMMVEELLEGEKAPELVFGAIYTGKITELLDRGVMLSLHPAMDPVLLHNSQLAGGKVSHPSALGLAPGQDLQVKYYGRDPATGQVRLSRKVLTVGAASAVKNLQDAMKR